MPSFTDSAICIRKLDWSETSQIVVLMTQEHGKVSATAKGAKRQSPSTLAKFSGGIELLTAGEAVLITKPAADLANLIEWDLRDGHWHLRRNLDGFHRAMYAADLVHHLVQDRDPHPQTYRLLKRFLEAQADPAAAAGALLCFQWGLIEDLGFQPILDRDAGTGRRLEESAATVAFSPAAGGVVADTGEGDRWRVRRETVDVLQQLAGGAGAPADPVGVARANRLLCAYLRSVLDRELPTMTRILADNGD